VLAKEIFRSPIFSKFSTTKLVSSKTSLLAASSGVSPGSIFPPGKFQPHLSLTNKNSPFSFWITTRANSGKSSWGEEIC
jgi:hypothetical protein